MSNIWKFGADVDTDQIVPGRYAPYMRPNDELGDAAFIEARPDFNKQAVPGDIIVATDNFGCGSSREYAPQALKRRQVGAIFANSFARIFYRNAINLGIPVFVDEDLVESLQQGHEASLDLAGGMLIIDGEAYDLPPVPNFAREIIDAGGIVPYVQEHGRFPNS